MLRDPRLRYKAQEEAWFHDSHFREGCECEGCKDKDGMDGCEFGCGWECGSDCKHYADERLETVNGIIASKGTEQYGQLLEE